HTIVEVVGGQHVREVDRAGSCRRCTRGRGSAWRAGRRVGESVGSGGPCARGSDGWGSTCEGRCGRDGPSGCRRKGRRKGRAGSRAGGRADRSAAWRRGELLV